MTATRRWTAALGAASLTAVMVTGCGSSEGDDGDAGAGALTVASVPVVQAAPLKVALEEGYFEEEGLDVTINEVTGPEALASLINGDADYASLGASVVATAASQNVPVSVVSGMTANTEDNGDVAVVTLPNSSVKSPEDLEGLTVGTSALSSVTTVMTRASIEAAGGDASAVRFIEITQPEQMAALRSGSIDATAVSEPYLVGMKQGGAREAFAVTNGLPDNTPVGVVATTTEYQNAKADEIEAFNRAMAKAVDWIDANEPALRALLPKLVGVTPEQADAMVLPTYTTEVDEAGFQAVVDTLVAQGLIEDAPDVAELVP